MSGISWSGRNVTKLPVIGKLTTKPLSFGNSSFPSSTYEIVEISDDGEIYITNQWYKSGVPQIIHKNLVQSYEPITENKQETMRAKFVDELNLLIN